MKGGDKDAYISKKRTIQKNEKSRKNFLAVDAVH